MRVVKKKLRESRFSPRFSRDSFLEFSHNFFIFVRSEVETRRAAAKQQFVKPLKIFTRRKPKIKRIKKSADTSKNTHKYSEKLRESC